jgi:AraC-like DNA-binding protein
MTTETMDLREQVDSLRRDVDRLMVIIESYNLSTTAHKVDAMLRKADLSRVRLVDIAEALALTDHALGSRLVKEGTRYQHLLDAERKRRVSERLKVQPDATCIQLTLVAGYSDHQNLVRAFQRWFGMTLSEYKELAGIKHMNKSSNKGNLPK